MDTMSQADREKLTTLLKYWMEHNREHGEEFREWAEKASGFGQLSVHRDIMEAAEQMDRANGLLLRALEALEGERS